MDIHLSIGYRVKTMRKLRGWTQQELAHKLDIDQTSLSKIEKSQFSPSIKLLEKMAFLFGKRLTIEFEDI